ncbi:tandem-95 repeat protein [Candidatus Woesearchaeota archaeon]|nr:tandem-95 repeat protein [Candidatus Woesearchaeota archaeon]
MKDTLRKTVTERIVAYVSILLIILTPFSSAASTDSDIVVSDVTSLYFPPADRENIDTQEQQLPVEGSQAVEVPLDMDPDVITTLPDLLESIGKNTLPTNLLSQFASKGIFTNDLFSGSAGYSYPLQVPPGVNGLQPSITINYNSHQGSRKGIVGTGWGMSTDFIYRDIEHTRSNSSDDTFSVSLNGMTMKLVYDTVDSLYHTEHETYMYITRDGNGWLLKSKDGTTYRFGSTTSSTLESSLETYTSVWYLDQVIDVHGNTITYEYLKNPGTDKAMYLSKIIYGDNTITFSYTFTQRAFYGYSYGTKIVQSGLLSAIMVENKQNLVRKYVFDYQGIDNHYLLKKIRHIGSDAVSELPTIEFSYYQNPVGWTENVSWSVPSEIIFGTDRDQGVRMFDINGDGLTDIARMNNSDNFDYWINNGRGWNSRQVNPNFLSKGFVDQYGNDLGVRFLDFLADTKIDLWKVVSGVSSINTFKENMGNGWQQNPLSLPLNVSFVEEAPAPTQCTPNWCPAGHIDGGVQCQGDTCTRFCLREDCVGSGTVAYEDNVYPYWDYGNNYQVYWTSGGWKTGDNVCVKFEYTGSPKTDPNDNSECYDLTTTNTYFNKDCDGVPLVGISGIGFAADRDPNSWLSTLAGGSDEGFLTGYDNAFWNNTYIAEPGYSFDATRLGNGDGEWDDFNNEICDEAGTYTIYCTPHEVVCDNWDKWPCGSGCDGEYTSAYLTMGIYARKYQEPLDNALANSVPACDWDVMKDNDYFGYGHYKVTKYDIQTTYQNQQCTFSPYDFRDTGVRLIDVNGDGESDLVKATNLERKTWLRTDSGWEETTDWIVPQSAFIAYAGGRLDLGVRFSDVNGDGFVDLVRTDNTIRITFLNDGKSFVQDDTWLLPQEALFIVDGVNQGLSLTDITGDGLPDLVKNDGNTRITWINNGRGWTREDSWVVPAGFKLNWYGTTLDDINGDGISDIIHAHNATNHTTLINNYQKQYLLKEVKGIYGDVTKIDYQTISSFDNTGGDQVIDLGSNGWVVTAVERTNGMTGDHSVTSRTSIRYRNGLFNPEKREFRGFNHVEETLPDQSTAKHWFYQDDVKKGLEYKTELFDSAARPFKTLENTFVTTPVRGYTVVTLQSSKESLYDGEIADPLITQQNFDYDSFGNVIKTSLFGNIALTGDEKFEHTSYWYNADKWILDRSLQQSLYGSDDVTLVRRQNYSYTSFGDVESAEQWLATGENPRVSFLYDSYGNVIAQTDARGYTTVTMYDPSHIFVSNVTNAKQQVTKYQYDAGTGNLLWVEDPNGYKIESRYDIFGRKTKEILPYDTESLPTVAYSYQINGSAPELIIIKSKENDTRTFDRYYHYDGFGNLIQAKHESQGPDFITYDLYYDPLLRISKESNPYSVSISGYTLPLPVETKRYSYDVLGRTTKIQNPDDTEVLTTYFHGNTLMYDENLHRKDVHEDAYGNILTVTEYNPGETYITSYTYNPAGDLTGITDNQANQITYIYDTFGRKIKMIDPDVGTWTYGYDKNNNVVNQTDNDGNTVRMAYDELNRITTKQTAEGTINYAYDEETVGTLSRMITPSHIAHYYYDNRLRVTKEDNVVDGLLFVTEWDYDSMDRVVTKQSPLDEDITFSYNTQSLLEQIGGIVTFNYNVFSQPTQRSYQNGILTTLLYYPKHARLQQIQTPQKQDLYYQYDNVGNIITITDGAHSIIKVFGYDWLDRLTRVVATQPTKDYTVDYAYDSIGDMKYLNISSQNPIYLERYQMNSSYTTNPVHAPSSIRLQYPDRHAPELFVPMQIVAEDFGEARLNIQDYSRDSDGDLLTFSLLEESPTTVDCTLVDTTLILTSNPNWNGLTSCTLLADDGRLGKTTQTMVINVTPVNDAPTLTIPDESLDEDSSPLNVNLQTYSFDVDGDALQFSVVNENPATVNCEILGSTLTMTPAANWNGQTTCTVEAADGNNGTAQYTFDITVLPVNDPPTLSLPVSTIDEDSGLSTLDLTLYADDVDGDPLLFMLTKENRSAVDCAVYGNMFSYQPILNWYGTSTCDVTVDDNHGGIAQDTMMVTVLPVNDAPVVYTISPIQVTEGNIIDQPIYAFDIEHDPLQYSVNDSRFTLTGARLTFKTQEGDADNFTIQISVDDWMNTTLQTIPITVQPFTGIVDTFYDGSGSKILTYALPGIKEVYVRVKKDSFLVNGSLTIQGYD